MKGNNMTTTSKIQFFDATQISQGLFFSIVKYYMREEICLFLANFEIRL